MAIVELPVKIDTLGVLDVTFEPPWRNERIRRILKFQKAGFIIGID